jgi:hypothetical protein
VSVSYTAGPFGLSAKDIEAAEVARRIVREVQHRHPVGGPRNPDGCELCRLLDSYDRLTLEEPA